MNDEAQAVMRDVSLAWVLLRYYMGFVTLEEIETAAREVEEQGRDAESR